MGIAPIKTDADYRATLKEIESLMIAKLNSQEGEKLNELVTLVQNYEAKHFLINLPAPVKTVNHLVNAI
jgi:HTH-type transcriptional regulator/antitoxin HigA